MAIMKCQEAVMKVLNSEGVEYVFGIPGATETYFMDALEGHPEVKYRLGLNENTVVGMAEGYARASGKTAFVNLHTGTGLASSLGMLNNCFNGGVPIVVTAGQQDTRLNAAEPALYDNLVKIASPFAKWGTEILEAADLPMIMRRAFKVAAHPPAGPVFVSLPMNILNEEIDFEYEKRAPSYTALHPDTESIKIAVDLLLKAKNPMIIVEDGVAKNDALAEVVKFAEQIGARVYQPWMSDVNFPVNHSQYLYDLEVNSLATRELLEKCDVLVVIGSLFFNQAAYLPKPLMTPKTKVIQIDNNSWQIGKNYPVACGIEGNIKVAVAELTGALETNLIKGVREEIKARIEVINREKQAMDAVFEAQAGKVKDNLPVHTTRLMQEIRDAMLPGTRIVDDCWSSSAVLRRSIPFSEDKAYMRSRGGGSIGWGLPGAIGVKLGSPDRPVVCISGDGSAMWSIQSLWTAASYNIPVTFIIISNGCYRQVRMFRSMILGERAKGLNLGTDISCPPNDFCKIAEGMGIGSQKVDRPGQLKAVLKSAFSLNKPNLVDVSVDAAL